MPEPPLPAPAPASRIISQLSTSTWAYAALGSIVESGLLEELGDSATPKQLAEQTGLTEPLVRAMLDVAIALELVHQPENGHYRVADGVLAFIKSPPGRGSTLFIRSDFLQTSDLLARARTRTLEPGWHYTDPDILNAQGIGSGSIMESLCRDVVPRLDGLAARLEAPRAQFLDVGAGVGGICIALARRWPNLRIVGLEPAAAPLEQARRNVGSSGVADRIEILPIRLDELTDVERFDAGWLPQVFLPLDVLERSLEPFYRSIKSGGWGILFALSADGAELGPSISRLRNVLWGGEPHPPSAVGDLMSRCGFRDIRIEPAGGIGGASLIIGRKPAR